MKSLITLIFIALSLATFGQSKSFSTLKNKFSGAEDVSTVRVGGFVLKTILWMAGETDWRDDFGTVSSVRVINIPKREFESRRLSADGFKKVLANDHFEEVAATYDAGEHLTIYIQDKAKGSDLYFLLVENNKEVTAIEIRGEIDAKKIIKDHQKHKLNRV
jgi:hypothetical protein